MSEPTARDLLNRLGTQPVEVRIANALEHIALELSAIRAVACRQSKATLEMARAITQDLDPYGLDDGGDD